MLIFWQIVDLELEQNSEGDWWHFLREYERTEQLRTAFAFRPAYLYAVYGIEPVGSFKHGEKEGGKSPLDDNCLLLWPNQMHPL